MILDRLPFAQRRSNGTIDAWAVQPTGNYETDCSTGNNYYEQLRFHAAEKNSHLSFSFVMQAMIEKGNVSGIEIGFLHSMSEHLGETA